MAGKPGQHKRPLNPMRVEEVRQKIRSTLLIKTLEDHAIDGVDMAPSRITAALGLLKKVIPDYAAVEVTGKDGGPIQLQPILNVTIGDKS